MQAADARAAKAIAASFAALAIYVAYESLGDLIGGTKPEASTVGVVLAAVSLALMPALAGAKARLAPVLGSVAAKADAAQTNLCALAVGRRAGRRRRELGRLVVRADPIAGIGIAVIAGAEAVRTWRADSLDDTCCP